MSRPGGIAGLCFLALCMLSGEADTTEVRHCLLQLGEKLTHSQVHGALHGLVRRRPPLAEITQHGEAGYGRPNRWRITGDGRAVAAGDDELARFLAVWAGQL